MSCLGKAMWDGSVGRECGPAVWDGGVGLSVGRRCGPAVWESIPFWQIFAVWVEIYDRRQLDSLPFSAVFHYLGRDLQTLWRNARVLHPTSHAFNDSNPLNACACPMLHPTSHTLYFNKKTLVTLFNYA